MYAADEKSRYAQSLQLAGQLNLTIKKCDGVKPECHRCIKHGVKCTGYPEKFSFREYKPPRKATTTDPASPQKSTVTESSATSSPKTLRSINASSPSSPFSAISVTSEIQPSRGLPECADWQSICNFMNQVVLRVHRSPCKGYLAFMPDLFQEKGDDPCLKHAILSISYLTLSNKTGHQELHLKARKNHGLSLEHLNKALGSRENAVKDEILAACLLLSIFYVRTLGAYLLSFYFCLSLSILTSMNRILSKMVAVYPTRTCPAYVICCSCARVSK